MRRRSGRRPACDKCVMSRPSSTIVPSLGSISRMIMRPMVDLPQPDSPTSPSTSPAVIENDTSSTARTKARMPPLRTAKRLLTLRTSSNGALMRPH
jgi:hypothetical protein